MRSQPQFGRFMHGSISSSLALSASPQRRWIDSMTTSYIQQLRQFCKDDESFERLQELLSVGGLGASLPSGIPVPLSGGKPRIHGDLALRIAQDQWLARLIDDVLPDVVYLYDVAEHRYVYVNQAIIRYGFTVERFTQGDSNVVNSLLHPSERATVVQQFEQAMERISKDIPLIDEEFTPFFEIQCRMQCADASYRWVHDRRYVLERNEHGLPSTILGYLHDLQSMRDLQDLLEYRTSLDKVTASISRDFAKASVRDVDDTINNALALIGQTTKTDRVYVFLAPHFEHTAEILHRTYDWCAPDVPHFAVSHIDLNELAWGFERLQQLRSIQIARLDTLPPEAERLRLALESVGTQSLLAVPLHISGVVIGMLGISAVREERVWTKEEVRMLRLNAEILVSAFERQLAEQTLRQSEARFRTIFDRAPLAISVLNPQGKLISHNERLAKLLGYTHEELVQLDFLTCVHPDFRDRSEELFYELLTGAINSLSLELQYIRKDGSPIWINLTSSVVRDKQQRPLFVIRMLEDISERKNAEANMTHYTTLVAEHREALERQSDLLLQLNGEMMQKQRELEDINRSKDKFFSIISHDLRSPFSSLIGISKLISEGIHDLSSDDLVELASAMHLQTQNVYDFMENLLKWAQAHTGRMEYKPNVMLLAEISGSVEMLMREAATAKGLVLENKVAPDVAVFIDENMIRSVVQNLVSNALKFTPSGGRVSIEVAPLADNTKMIEVRVRDTGVGMSHEDAQKLFRIDIVHTTKGTEDETGSGLGLILCKELVEKNKGKIRVESVQGQGTTFAFTVPLAKAL
ncbi:MAG: PAS domain S-box protein [Candidatus Kapaibacterium sp.]|nr:MAG: PAS domain S-box protein [Candidatus Kapabacteria bacterium]